MKTITYSKPFNHFNFTLLWLIPAFFTIIWGAMNSTQMWLGGLAITLALFIIGQLLFRRHARIERVVNEYLKKFHAGDFHNGLDALLRAGVCELKSRWELNEVCHKIKKREKFAYSPLDSISLLPKRKAFTFIKWCWKNKKDVSSASNTLILISQFKGEFPNDE